MSQQAETKTKNAKASPSTIEPTIADQIKERLRDGKKHRFIFSRTSQVLVQENSFAVTAKSHHGLVTEFGFPSDATSGGYLEVNGNNYVLLDETSTSLPKPTQEEFDSAVLRGFVIV